MKVGVVISIITMNVCFIFEVKAATWSGTFRVYNIINKHWKPAADGDAIIRGG